MGVGEGGRRVGREERWMGGREERWRERVERVERVEGVERVERVEGNDGEMVVVVDPS